MVLEDRPILRGFSVHQLIPKRLLLTLAALTTMPLLHYGQTPGTTDNFPLQVTIDSVRETDASIGISAEQRAQAAANGMELPYFVFFDGKINGDGHFVLSCRKENSLRESLPCTKIPIGEYRGRWIHNHVNLEIIGAPDGKQITRFLIVESKENDPPPADDPLLQMTAFDFPVRFPSGKGFADYPVLAHVYGGFSIELPVGMMPERTRCTAYVWSSYQGSVNCSDYPAVQVTRGYVTLDISAGKVPFASLRCEAKWRWSHCSLLDPGLYYGRIDKDRMILLTHDANGNPVEVGFEVQTDQKRVESPVK